MCIIVAKPAGVAMPDMKILENCFNNNPDGAGIMFSHNGKVLGFKGLMSLEAFKAQLAKLKKKYGKLTDKAVVMHFRIGTHGGCIAANTHPFPVVGSYKAMRKLEWVSNLGMAHNGIITSTARHIDIKKQNVSDTMVFIRRVVNPIASVTNIMKSKQILNALYLSADSKLAFLDASGNLEVLGDFIFENGVHYSNSSYSHERLSLYRGWKAYDSIYDGWYDDYARTPSKKVKYTLSNDDLKFAAQSAADEYGLELLDFMDTIVFPDGNRLNAESYMYAFDYTDGMIYEFDDDNLDWYPVLAPGEYDYIDRAGDTDQDA